MSADRQSDPRAPRGLSPWLEVRTGRRADLLEVSVLGEIDLANHHELQQLLGGLDLSASPRVDLDLSQLSFSDARGACHLLDFVERTTAAGGHVQIVNAQPAVARLLGLLTRLPDSA